MAGLPPPARPRTQHESARKLPRQRLCRKLLPAFEVGTYPASHPPPQINRPRLVQLLAFEAQVRSSKGLDHKTRRAIARLQKQMLHPGTQSKRRSPMPSASIFLSCARLLTGTSTMTKAPSPPTALQRDPAGVSSPFPRRRAAVPPSAA